ncbi:MAG: GNAT family N-acetyltransferase [Oscillospiraceae bacterium]
MINCKFYDTLPDEARYIREEVFVREQGFQNEFDDTDNTALHTVVYYDNEPAAAARIFPSERDNFYTVGRIAVLPQYRNKQLGRYIMVQMEEKARGLGAEGIELSAQCRARGFYEKCGYTAEGGIYLDEFCEHIHMVKKLG